MNNRCDVYLVSEGEDSWLLKALLRALVVKKDSRAV